MTSQPKTTLVPDRPTYSPTVVSFGLILNVGLSITIVLLNKKVYTEYGFPNMTMTCLHFLCTSIGIFICRFMGMFEAKELPLLKMIPISLSFCGFVVFTNLSLQTNSVGTYQIIKTMTTPCIMVIQSLYYSRTFSTEVRLTLIPIALGVFLNSYFDLRFNLLGIIFASIGVLVTSLYQVWVAEKQHEYQMNSMQLLFYQAPLSAITLALVIPFFEPVLGPGGIFGPWPPEAIMMVSATGLVAFAVNLSIFWIIGNTSPLTYNMVGHFKFCLTLIGGFVLFRDPLQPVQLGGIFLTVGGVFAYTHFKLQEQSAAKKEQAKQIDNGNNEPPISESYSKSELQSES